jgi:hypothetical protein
VCRFAPSLCYPAFGVELAVQLFMFLVFLATSRFFVVGRILLFVFRIIAASSVG